MRGIKIPVYPSSLIIAKSRSSRSYHRSIPAIPEPAMTDIVLKMFYRSMLYSRESAVPRMVFLKKYYKHLLVLLAFTLMGYGFSYFARGAKDGNLADGMSACGQSVGLIPEVKPTAEIVKDVMAKANNTADRVGQLKTIGLENSG